jgi:hypothetical protein
MRVKFDEAITVSNRLITDEWKAMGTARRLAEGNDQLLDMLLDINEQTRAPARLRFNLDPASAQQPVAAGEPEAIRQQLHELRDAVASGALSQEDYIDRAELLHNSQAIRQTLKSLATLQARVPHTAPTDVADRAPDGIDLSEHAPGYMSPAHEEEYLAALDQVLAQPDFDPALQEGRPIRHAASHPPLSEKDLTIRNPDSVYNWLRKHQPQVFLQDKDAAHHENMSEKAAPVKASASSRKGIKRESAVGGGTPGPRGADDDDDSVVAGETGGKGRRKTAGGGGGGGAGGDDDTAYRPKGGSSRPAKRKREDGDTPAAKSKKKSRASTAGTGA